MKSGKQAAGGREWTDDRCGNGVKDKIKPN